jgi:SsrA-binding protein
MKILASNRRAKFDYDISETLVAGVVLSGAEVKSAKAGHISLKGSYATINRGELYLLNAHISPYASAKSESFEQTRSRKLLIHKTQLNRLIGLKQSGLSLVPLAIGQERGLVKVEVGIGRGRKVHDKRSSIKARQAQRDIDRAKKSANA